MGHRILLILFILVSCSQNLMAVNFPQKECLPNSEISIKVATEILKGQVTGFKVSEWMINSKEDGDRYKVTFKYKCPTGRKCIGGLARIDISKKNCTVLHYSAER